MCTNKTSFEKFNYRPPRICWKITKILKTLIDNKPQAIPIPIQSVQFSITLFTFCAVPIVMATYTFIALDNCSPNNMVQSSSSYQAVVSRLGCKAVICSHIAVISLLSGCHEAIIKQSFFKISSRMLESQLLKKF